MEDKKYTLADLDVLLAEGKEIWVRLYSDILICLVENVGNGQYRGKYTPCAKNSRSYSIRRSEIKELK